MTHRIGLATAPAFLLGAVAGLLGVLVGRLNTIMVRSRMLHAISEDDVGRTHLRNDIPIVLRRAYATELAIRLCALSGILTGWVVVLVFIDALFNLHNNRAIALMFIGAMSLFSACLGLAMYEIRTSMRGHAHYDA